MGTRKLAKRSGVLRPGEPSAEAGICSVLEDDMTDVERVLIIAKLEDMIRTGNSILYHVESIRDRIRNMIRLSRTAF